jgi:hypothetical protein
VLGSTDLPHPNLNYKFNSLNTVCKNKYTQNTYTMKNIQYTWITLDYTLLLKRRQYRESGDAMYILR